MAYGFYFDSTRCTGCRTCEMACKDYHDLSTEAAFRRVFDYEGGEFVENADGTVTATTYAYHLSEACNHCESPKCFAACPTGAIEKVKTASSTLRKTCALARVPVWTPARLACPFW